NPGSKFMYQGIYKNGSYHNEESILPSIPMYFGLIEEEKTTHMLKTFASHEYTADWGVRMTSIHNPNYHPQGYHSGAVWPLYSGWVALAEYKYHRPLQGFGHIMSNLNNYRDFSLGYTEEVLNGEKYLPSGVCPHQCWSETMVLQPIIEGMLGIIPDADDDVLGFYPTIPFEWNQIEVNNIRVGQRIVGFKMKRTNDSTTYTFTGDIEGLYIHFEPAFQQGTAESRQVNGIVLFTYVDQKFAKASFFQSKFKANEPITVPHQGGISLIPPIEKPAKGEQSRGIRIIDATWKDNTYTIEVEGAPAMSYELEVINNFGTPKAVEGATYREEGNRLFLEIGFPALNRVYMPGTIKIRF
ncbi:MAG: hypothetical protein KAR09_04545, partial [Bacteroidales bacterium]|nr:hypothetical protein [Bacteroidales bacterium]